MAGTESKISPILEFRDRIITRFCDKEGDKYIAIDGKSFKKIAKRLVFA
jgi:ribose 1,5-bisphosphokinase PhnN